MVEMVKKVVKKQQRLSKHMTQASERAAAADMKSQAVGVQVSKFCQGWDYAPFSEELQT